MSLLSAFRKKPDGDNPKAKTPGALGGHYSVFALKGELDETRLEEIQAQLAPLLADKSAQALILDCSQMSYLNSRVIGYIVSLHTHLSREGRRLILAHAQEAVMDVFQLVGLATIIPYFATVEEAVSQ